MSDRPHLLLVAYYFPPTGMGGVQRPLKMAKYLPEFGWDVTVITAAQTGSLAIDPTLVDDLPDSVTVRHVRTRDPGNILRARRHGTRAPMRAHRPPPRWAKSIQQIARWPDDKFAFIRPAVRAAARLTGERRLDVVLTTSPPPSLHRVGLLLQRQHGIPWIADFRDPWLVREGDWGPTRWHKRYAMNLREQICRKANRIISVNEAITATLNALQPREPVETIHNGFDEADFADLPQVAHDGSELRVVFYGTLAPIVDPTPAFRMLAKWRALHPNHKLRIVHIGVSVGIDAEQLAEAHGLDDVFEAAGYHPHRDAIAQLCRADVIVIPLTTDPDHRSTVPGRLFEAMRSLRPILMLAPDTSTAAEILSRVDGQWVVAPDDTDAGLTALNAIAGLPKGQAARSVESLAHFGRREQARRIAAILDSLRGQRG
jgi:glycosyltransferase involved in cell wall biosynthesis